MQLFTYCYIRYRICWEKNALTCFVKHNLLCRNLQIVAALPVGRSNKRKFSLILLSVFLSFFLYCLVASVKDSLKNSIFNFFFNIRITIATRMYMQLVCSALHAFVLQDDNYFNSRFQKQLTTKSEKLKNSRLSQFVTRSQVVNIEKQLQSPCMSTEQIIRAYKCDQATGIICMCGRRRRERLNPLILYK